MAFKVAFHEEAKSILVGTGVSGYTGSDSCRDFHGGILWSVYRGPVHKKMKEAHFVGLLVSPIKWEDYFTHLETQLILSIYRTRERPTYYMSGPDYGSAGIRE